MIELDSRTYLWHGFVIDVDELSGVRVDLQCAVEAEGRLYRIRTYTLSASARPT